ncbi:MAG TPA: universal stress protein [Gaiellales bacterium]|nr:universal stress protein [Gaiellales bacterium]
MGEILIATDGSRAARAAESVGFELARTRGATALLVCVWAPLRGSFGLPVPEFLDPEFIDAERSWAEETLAAAASRAADSEVHAETLVAKGRPVEEICRAARDRSADMIVIGSEGWGAVLSMVLGRTTLGVLQHAPCPVVVVRDISETTKEAP